MLLLLLRKWLFPVDSSMCSHFTEGVATCFKLPSWVLEHWWRYSSSDQTSEIIVWHGQQLARVVSFASWELGTWVGTIVRFLARVVSIASWELGTWVGTIVRFLARVLSIASWELGTWVGTIVRFLASTDWSTRHQAGMCSCPRFSPTLYCSMRPCVHWTN